MGVITVDNKLTKLRDILNEYGKIAVAFSGGVDSTFLAAIAYEVLGKSNSLALTAVTGLNPQHEIEQSKSIADNIGITHELINLDVFSNAEITSNPPDRCYICKATTFTLLSEKAAHHGFTILADGSNVDDTGDYRPGMKALTELGVKSPLIEAGLTKDEIRQLSRELGIEGAERPASPCLATRIPYGTCLDKGVLSNIEKAEQMLTGLGFTPVRVRVHGDIARIEIDPEMHERFLINREFIVPKLSEMGFTYVTLDIEGFKSGSMNKPILENV